MSKQTSIKKEAMKKNLEDLIIYLDDDDETITRWCNIIEKSQSFVTFRVSDTSPCFSIPWTRIKKIKEKEAQ